MVKKKSVNMYKCVDDKRKNIKKTIWETRKYRKMKYR